MKKITHWSIDHFGSIRGDTIGEPIDKGIRTSPVVARDGNVVTTRSGNRYELVDPCNPFLADPELLKRNWKGATSALDAVDKCMQRNADQ
jgi:hypothetical protein